MDRCFLIYTQQECYKIVVRETHIIPRPYGLKNLIEQTRNNSNYRNREGTVRRYELPARKYELIVRIYGKAVRKYERRDRINEGAFSKYERRDRTYDNGARVYDNVGLY